MNRWSLYLEWQNKRISKFQFVKVILLSFFASPIPGNEISVSKIIDLLFRAGAEVVYYGERKVHVSGHGSQEELKLMLNLMKPKYFVPVHGEFRMQKAHAYLAEDVGITRENIFIVEKAM